MHFRFVQASESSELGIRFIFFGLCNGWPVLIAPCAAAVAGDSRQSRVLGLIMACGSGTQLVGPGIGGWTYGLAALLREVGEVELMVNEKMVRLSKSC